MTAEVLRYAAFTPDPGPPASAGNPVVGGNPAGVVLDAGEQYATERGRRT